MQVVIVGDPKALRNPSLSDLKRHFPVKYQPPVYISELDEAATTEARGHMESLLGRKVSDGEVGCLLAHSEIWKTLDTPWTLVLEDDASIPATFLADLETLLGHLPPGDSRAIVTLYGTNRPRGSKVIKRLRYVPSGTVAYLMSEKTRELALGTLSGTADWPIELTQAKFYAAAMPVVEEAGMPSTVHHESNSAPWYYLKTLGRLWSVWRFYGRAGIRYVLTSPAMRDLTHRWNALMVKAHCCLQNTKNSCREIRNLISLGK